MDFLLERFATVPGEIAFIADDQISTYGELLGQTEKFSALIQEKNIPRGDVVAVLGDYSPAMFCFILALVKNQNVFVPLTQSTVVEKSKLLEISQSQWFVEFSADIAQIKIEQLAAIPCNPLLLRLRESGDPGLLLFSSGSTGEPKAILHNFRQVAEKFKTPRQRMVAITFLTLDHFGGINTLLAITSSLGTVVTVSNRSVGSICETIQKHKVELLPTTPSFLNLFVQSGIFKHFDLSSLRTISYGTEVMPQATLERLRKIFPGVKLQQTYGLSELGVLRSQSRDDGTLWVKIGGQGFKTKVVDGILWVQSDYAMLGYLNAPSPFDSEGWFNTQDQVEVDGDYFRILGRETDIINIGGQKVYPAEIEDVILRLENIEDVAVYGEKHPLLGNIVVAEVVLLQPEPVSSLKLRIRKACLEKLSPFKAPAKVVLAKHDIYSSRLKKIRGVRESSRDEPGVAQDLVQ